MPFPFLRKNSIVVFHSFHRKTTVNKNGHNSRYAHSLFAKVSINKT